MQFHKFMKFFDIAVLLLLSFSAFAQKSEAEMRKEMYENIDKQIERLEDVLKLEEWQVFYIDSILVHDTEGRVAELKKLQKSGATNQDAFYFVSDKWAEKTYQAFRKVLNDEQWEMFLKDGAQRGKRDRDKRAAKRNKNI